MSELLTPHQPQIICCINVGKAGASERVFNYTSLNAIEVELRGGRFRYTNRSVSAPEQMLPYERGRIIKLLEEAKWIPLPPEQERHLDAVSSAWLETVPPQTYTQPRGLGYEDGYVEALVLRADGTRRSVRIDPRGDYDSLSSAPPEWDALIAFLRALASLDGIARPNPR